MSCISGPDSKKLSRILVGNCAGMWTLPERCVGGSGALGHRGDEASVSSSLVAASLMRYTRVWFQYRAMHVSMILEKRSVRMQHARHGSRRKKTSHQAYPWLHHMCPSRPGSLQWYLFPGLCRK